MANLLGSIDLQLRPLVRIRFASFRDDVVAMLDTGFNGELMINISDVDSLGVTLSPLKVRVTLAGGQRAEARQGEVQIEWMGQVRRVGVFVSETEASLHRDGDPIALIGTRLLAPHLLLIDFDAGSVEIEAQD